MTNNPTTASPPPTSLTDLPPELLDQITTYLPGASSIAHLASTSKALHSYVEKDAWNTFNRSRFPSLIPAPSQIPGYGTSGGAALARTLTTLSRNLDRRGLVARGVEPGGGGAVSGGDGGGGVVRAFPGRGRLERWKRPKGQTVGFVPVLSCYQEDGVGGKEVLGFSAGAGFCVRVREEEGVGRGQGQSVKAGPGTRWMSYRPYSAVEGRDDITALHLLREPARMPSQDMDPEGEFVVMGTANGDLQLIHLPSGEHGAGDVETFFTTQGRPIRSSSLLQPEYENPTLAAALGDSKVALYSVDSNQSKVAPMSEVEALPATHSATNGASNGTASKSTRVWSTTFLSPQRLAVGVGPSQEPLQIHDITPTGISPKPVRRFSFTDRPNALDDRSDEIAPNGILRRPTSSVYPTAPLPPSNSASSSDSVFLSGGYDGIVRLHDLRSPSNHEQKYSDPVDDAPIYSLLTRGRETLIAGSSRHSILKLFDLRLGAKSYSYLDATARHDNAREVPDWNLFLKPHSASYPGRGGGNNWARRSAESSVYSLASPSPCSPHLYAGLENAVVELAFTGVCDAHPDPAVRRGMHPAPKASKAADAGILDLAGYVQGVEMKLLTQRSVRETRDGWERGRVVDSLIQNGGVTGKGILDGGDGLGDVDERWRVGT
ncbi:hypothetical protein MBLNU230_g7269t1 [Neophaeotheca triangularis]